MLMSSRARDTTPCSLNIERERFGMKNVPARLAGGTGDSID